MLLILNAIFTTVNKNDHTNDSAFNGANKNYTTTMKNANNTVKSVVTVQNDLSNNTTVPKSKSGSDNEIDQVSSTKSGRLYLYFNECTCCR